MLFGLIAAEILSSGPAPNSGIKIQQVTYHGWTGCIRMSNGEVELIYVPEIGRIMRYARLNQPNTLWENPAMAGKPYASAKKGEWANYGGDKLWPAPQSLWNWPPDPILDGPTNHAEISGSKLLIEGHSSLKSGVRFSRQITLDRTSTVVHILNTMRNTSDKVESLAIWEIAQTNDPSKVIVPLEVTRELPEGWAPYDKAKIEPEFARVQNGVLEVHRNPNQGFKLGSASSQGFIRAVLKNGEEFTMSVRKEKGAYGDDGKFLAVYASSDPTKYVELETTGPMTQLAPGQSCRFEVTWRLEVAKGQ